jgi:hypothetical protein
MKATVWTCDRCGASHEAHYPVYPAAAHPMASNAPAVVV